MVKTVNLEMKKKRGRNITNKGDEYGFETDVTRNG